MINRERLIESIGIEATEEIRLLQEDIEALIQYLGVIRVYGTRGFQFQKLISYPLPDGRTK